MGVAPFRAALFSAQWVSLRGLQPEQNNLPEEAFLDVAKRDRLVQVAFRQLFRDERHRQARMFQQTEIGRDVGGRGEQAVEKTHQIADCLLRIGQRNARDDFAAGLEIRDAEYDRGGRIHDLALNR